MSDRMFWIILAVIIFAVVMLVFNDSSGQTVGLENDDFATIIWYGIFVAVLAALLLRRGIPTGNLLGYVALWLGIFVAFVALYYILERSDMLPENFRPRVLPPSDSGTGVPA